MTPSSPARRNLVLCADGTCNAFGHSHSNVARLLQCIELHRPDAQVACYDQGIGTSRGEHVRIRTTLGAAPALRVLEPPDDSWSRPTRWISKIRSMACGDGLDTNVRQLYEALAGEFQPGDRVFLFGFSRGAFTVRALAGLVWRYGLPSQERRTRAGEIFDEAWPLFVAEFPDEGGAHAEAARRFIDRHGQRECPVHFLGLWDTVKSYGGLTPVMLPHLRHNPGVSVVRHALALDERRGWFEATTWGWLDSDRADSPGGRPTAASRLSEEDRMRIAAQNVAEVWFSGCHADIGGGAIRGAQADETSDIALRWMLGEAAAEHLVLSDTGRAVLALPRAAEKPQVRQSRGLLWRLVELKRRRAIDNSGRWPITISAPRGASPRTPARSSRDRTIWHHETVEASRLGPMPEGVVARARLTRRLSDLTSERPASLGRRGSRARS